MATRANSAAASVRAMQSDTIGVSKYLRPDNVTQLSPASTAFTARDNRRTKEERSDRLISAHLAGLAELVPDTVDEQVAAIRSVSQTMDSSSFSTTDPALAGLIAEERMLLGRLLLTQAVNETDVSAKLSLALERLEQEPRVCRSVPLILRSAMADLTFLAQAA